MRESLDFTGNAEPAGPGLQHISRMELSATGVANLDRNIGRPLDTLAMLGRPSNPPVLDRAISFTAAVARA